MARRVNAEQYGLKRRRILDHAAHLFAEFGYDRTTTAQLCAAVGISPGNLYHYFRSKRQIFLAVLTEEDAGTEDLWKRLLGEGDPLDALLRYVEHLAAPAIAHPVVPKLVLEAVSQAQRDQTVAEALAGSGDAERQGMEQLLRRVVEAGRTVPALDPRGGAEWITAMINALFLHLALRDEDDVNPDRYLEHLRRTVIGYLTVEPDPAVGASELSAEHRGSPQ